MLICSDVITMSSSGFPECSVDWTVQLASLPFDINQLDPVLATQLFAGGFMITIVPWSVAYGISKLLKTIGN